MSWGIAVAPVLLAAPASQALLDTRLDATGDYPLATHCHGRAHADQFFVQGDKAVMLYNKGYYEPATVMLEQLREKGLLGDKPWDDEFQITDYYLWHHEARRARRGALMGAPDYAHWHGFFELQQYLYKLENIHRQRLETGRVH